VALGGEARAMAKAAGSKDLGFNAKAKKFGLSAKAEA